MSRPRGGTGNSKKQGRQGAGSLILSKEERAKLKEEQRFKKLEDEVAAKKLLKSMKKSPRSTVREELPDVLVSLVKQAKDGSCPHAKILLEFADAENLPDAKEQQKSETLAELLIEKLG